MYLFSGLPEKGYTIYQYLSLELKQKLWLDAYFSPENTVP